MSARRVAAIGALLLGFGGFGLAVVVAVQEFPRGLLALACVALAAAAAWYGVLRRGRSASPASAVGVLGLGAAIVLLGERRLLEELLVVGCARAELRLRAGGVRRFAPGCRRRPAPQRPVLFFNPKSGGGKAERFSVAAEARARGIEPIELGPPWDLEGLVRDAVAARRRRAGDGGRRRLAGDRRRDRGGARPALRVRAGGHAQPLRARPRRRSRRRRRRARRVRRRRRAPRGPGGGQRARVRQQRLARALRRGGPAQGLPRREAAHAARHGARGARARRDRARPALDGPRRAGAPSGAAILVSNNRYRLGRAIGSGTRPRIDDGLLGIAIVGAAIGRGACGQPAAATMAGVDRPGLRGRLRPIRCPPASTARRSMLEPPLRFRIRPGVLRVRIARRHPGASPSATMPEGLGPSARALARIAAGRDPASAAPGEPSITLRRNRRRRRADGHLRSGAEGAPHS